MTGKRLRKLLSVLALGALLVRPAAAQLEGPVEQGLAQLASQIVTKSKAAGKAAIAVLPFPNADGSCSVLSNFIADELIQSLFSVPGSGLEIVERSQLETVIKELKLGASGLLNPETTKKLGSQSGVSALIVGTITVIGDTVRINARLIATDTGKAISAAAVAIPKVAAVSELLKQPITAGPTCAPLTKDGVNHIGNPLPSTEPNFTDNFDTGPDNTWIRAGGDWQMANGALVNTGQLGILWLGQQNWSDYVVEFDSQSRYCGGNPVEVLVRMKSTSDFVAVRVAGCDNEGTYLYRDGAIAKQMVRALGRGKHWQIIAIGSVYKVVVDGTQRSISTDSTFLTGSIGIRMGAEGIIDNFTVRPAASGTSRR